MLQLDPTQLTTGDRYKLLIGSVVPRPIAFVSTINRAGQTNLAPYSFFNAISADPMLVLFCPANKLDGTEKDSLVNASPAPIGTGQFVVNIVSEAFAERMAQTAAELPHGESEFDLAGFAAEPSVRVAPPRVGESPVAFECETHEIHRYGPGQPAGGNLVIGRVVYVHVGDGVVNDRYHVDADRLGAVGRMGGLSYSRTRDRFDMKPGAPAKAPGPGR